MTSPKPTLRLPNVDAAEPSVSRFELERYIAGEVAGARRAEIAAMMEKDAALSAAHDALVDELRAADAAFKIAVPLERFLHDHAAKTTSPPSPFASIVAFFRNTRVQAGLGVCAAAAAVVLVVTRPADDGGADGNTRDKGGARVSYFVRDEAAAHRGVDGEQLGAGARIQFEVRDADRASMVLVGVDGRGEVTVYGAEDLATERPKGDNQRVRLIPASVVLDDSTGAERFFVVYADGSVDDVRAQVEEAAHALAAAHTDLASPSTTLALPKSFVQSSVHIVKVSR